MLLSNVKILQVEGREYYKRRIVGKAREEMNENGGLLVCVSVSESECVFVCVSECVCVCV